MEQYAGFWTALVGALLAIAGYIYTRVNKKAGQADYLGLLPISTKIQIAEFGCLMGLILVIVGLLTQATI